MASRIEEIANKLGEALPDVDYGKYYEQTLTDNQQILRVVDYFTEIESFFESGDSLLGAKTPFKSLDEKLRFRGGEVTLWTGYNSHKKSMMLGFFAINFIRQQERVCIASLEMRPVKTIIRMAKQFSELSEITENSMADFMQFAGNDLYIFNHIGGITPQRLFGVIAYAASKLNVKHFVIDSLMRVVASEDDYNAQKNFVVELCNIAQKYNIHIHLVHHVRDGDENKVSSRYSAKGSKAISDNVHNSIIVWSNKNKIEEMPDAVLKCDKQREGEWEGMLALNFHAESLNFSEAYRGE
jgi:twinkle protein